MEESSDLVKLRRDKLAQLCSKGVNPYLNRFKVKGNIGSLIDKFSENSRAPNKFDVSDKPTALILFSLQ